MSQSLRDALQLGDSDEFFEDGEFSTSDTESECYPLYDDNTASKDYHLGRQYMRLTQTLDLTRTLADSITAMEIDARVEARLQKYDYGQAFGYLLVKVDSVTSLELSATVASTYESFHCAAGHILRRSDGAEMTALNACCYHPDGNMDSVSIQPTTIASPRFLLSASQIEKGASKLKLYQEAFRSFKKDLLEAANETITSTNSKSAKSGSWQSRITFRGIQFVGNASNMADAETEAVKRFAKECKDITVKEDRDRVHFVLK